MADQNEEKFEKTAQEEVKKEAHEQPAEPEVSKKTEEVVKAEVKKEIYDEQLAASEASKKSEELAKVEVKKEHPVGESKGEKKSMTSITDDATKETSRLKMRKQSIGMSAIPNLRKPDTTSMMGLEYKRPLLVYEPTYQLNPSTRFNCFVIERLINSVLDVLYEGHCYHVDASPALAVSIANKVMRETKLMLFNRYRILAIIALGQKRSQSYVNTISFVWDGYRDAYVDVQRDNPTSFIQVTVFGVYLD